MASKPKLTDVKGVAASRAKQLETLKIRTVEDLAAADEAMLTTIAGISPAIAQKLKSAAATLLRAREITDDEPDSIEVTPELLARLRNSDALDDAPEPQALSKPKATKSKDKVAKKPTKAAKNTKEKADKPKMEKADKPKMEKADKPKKEKKVDMVDSLLTSVKAEAKAPKKAGKKAVKKALKLAHELAEKAVSKARKQAAKLEKRLEKAEKRAAKQAKKAAKQAGGELAEATEQFKRKAKKSKT